MPNDVAVEVNLVLVVVGGVASGLGLRAEPVAAAELHSRDVDGEAISRREAAVSGPLVD